MCECMCAGRGVHNQRSRSIEPALHLANAEKMETVLTLKCHEVTVTDLYWLFIYFCREESGYIYVRKCVDMYGEG